MNAVTVLDLETVVEPWWTPPPDKPDAFAPAFAWRIVCAGLVVLTTEGPAVTSHVGDERTILLALRDLLADAETIVTWRGRMFDLPVVMARSLVHGVEQGWYYAGRRGAGQDPRYRYAGATARHLDLYDQLSDYGACNPGKLDHVARALGYDGKGGVSGADVAGMYARGEIDAVARYCERDALLTAALWSRWRLLTSDATEERTARREAWIRERLAERGDRDAA